MAELKSQDRQGAFKPCRSTRHCADHGFCNRCAPVFSAAMSDVNCALAEGGARDDQRGFLYHLAAKALMPYFLSQD